MANLSKYNRGSEWRKWDLHFHTPSSFDYDKSDVDNNSLIDGLLTSDIKLVAITDHHYIDVNRIKELRKLAGEHITILPGIELRSDLGREPIHYIGIFSEQMNLDHLWDTIKGTFGLTPDGIKEKGGDDRVYVPMDDAHSLFRKLGGIITIHAGSKPNSIEGISNKEQFQQRIKYDITKAYVDILEIGQLKDVKSYMNIVFPKTGLNLPLIIGSDCHNIEDYGQSQQCWYKADPTFIGLRQVLNEPIERVCLEDFPAIFSHVDANKTRYIQSIAFSKRTESTLPEEWFSNVSLQFNPGLVAVIGNKGAGKSALTDVIGLLGNCPHEDSFSFLHTDQFKHPRENKAQHFDATLTWISGDPIRCNLGDSYDPSAVVSINYIPQFHLDAICDELKGGREGKFNEELKQVIFSRVPVNDRLEKKTLDEVISFKTREIQESIGLIVTEMKEVLNDIIHLEMQSTKIYQKNLESELKAIQDEIKAHKGIEPKKIDKPSADPEKQKIIEESTQEIDKLLTQINDLDGKIEEKSALLGDTTLKLELISKLRKKIGNFETQYNTLLTNLKDDCSTLKLDISRLIKVEIDEAPIKELEDRLLVVKRDLEVLLSETGKDSLILGKKSAKEAIQALREKLDRPNKEYQSYLGQKKGWDQKLKSLIGDNNTSHTEKYLVAQLEDLEHIPERMREKRKELSILIQCIYQEKRKQMEIFKSLYKPVQEFIDQHPLAHERFGLEFSASLTPHNFIENFLDFINQGKKGSFYGSEEGSKVLRDLINSVDFESEKSTMEFVELLTSYLHFDYRDPKPEPIEVSSQLRNGVELSDLYTYIYSLEYLCPRYELKWEGKTLERLSPGERGALLLIFYLLIDKSNKPLVMDQPEGNLDNQTVFQLLVDCVKEAKKRRQIIVVTHNPNLAVVCDAEQIIYATLDKENQYQLKYISGALENPEICKAIVNVLEGTKPAIDNRVAKYRIIFDGI